MTTTPRKSESRKRSLKLVEIARLVGGELTGNGAVTITGVAGIKEAQQGDITFLANDRYLPFLSATKASAVIAPKDHSDIRLPAVRSEDPSRAFTKIVEWFSEGERAPEPGVHPTAVVDKSAKLAAGVHVAPNAVIEAGVTVGRDSVIGAGVFVGRDSAIGALSRIHPNVSIRERSRIGDRVVIRSGSVIGADGFGYETVGGAQLKIPQTGCVQIDDDVEIGANVCIDRGRFDSTRIGRGTKIDNLVQIAHNVVIGENCLIVSQAGISGSVTLGKNVVVAGQAGIVGHLTLGDHAVVGAQSGVTKSVPEGTVVLGGPAKPLAEQKKLFALIARLPELFKDLADLKKKIGAGPK